MSDLGQRLIGLVRKHAENNSDFIYPEDDCVYVKDGQPSCLIGQALWDEGLIDSTLPSSWNGKIVSDDDDFGPGIASMLDLELDAEELTWLRAVQSRQDYHLPWGKAVQITDAETVQH